MTDQTAEQTEWVSPRAKLIDIINEYQMTYGYTFNEAIKAMRHDLQVQKNNVEYTGRFMSVYE